MPKPALYMREFGNEQLAKERVLNKDIEKRGGSLWKSRAITAAQDKLYLLGLKMLA
jgi:hypothetical protein